MVTSVAEEDDEAAASFLARLRLGGMAAAVSYAQSVLLAKPLRAERGACPPPLPL